MNGWCPCKVSETRPTKTPGYFVNTRQNWEKHIVAAALDWVDGGSPKKLVHAVKELRKQRANDTLVEKYNDWLRVNHPNSYAVGMCD